MTDPKCIAYQGEPGANSHIACAERFPDMIPLPCATFEDAFAAIADGAADLGMIPIENSIAGRVADIHNLLPASGLHIVGETFLPIHFQLLGVKGASVADLRSVHSHIHALGQCRKIIRKLGLKAVVAGDTAGSAREVAEWGDLSKASLATKLAGEIYGLDNLGVDVEDEAHNTTRFVVLSKTPRWAPAGEGATNSVNMTKLESYMVEGEFAATQFLSDVDGHPDDPALRRALEELRFFSKEVRVLGVYPAHPFRVKTQQGAE
jgi:prephenate dehydratase